MQILCAYIRENAPASEAKDHDISEPSDGSSAKWWRQYRGRLQEYHAAPERKKPRVDVQTALTAIGRREQRQIDREKRSDRDGSRRRYRLDLRKTSLQRADLSGLDFRDALFTDARLEGANCSNTRMQGSDLSSARLTGARCPGARMQRAVLFKARLEGANLWAARLQRADLRAAELQAANLEAAQMQEARLAAADMRGAVLDWSILSGLVTGRLPTSSRDSFGSRPMAPRCDLWICDRWRTHQSIAS